MPNVVGSLLAQSDVKDLTMHTELCGDAYYQLHEAGKLTNARCSLHRSKGLTGIVFGSRALYDWVDRNPGVTVAPLEYVNAPATIARLENMVSINSCISADLYGQVCAESAGLRHISGTGCAGPASCPASTGTSLRTPGARLTTSSRSTAPSIWRAGPPGSGRNCWSPSPTRTSGRT